MKTVCERCGVEFNYTSVGKTVVSCPACGALLGVGSTSVAGQPYRAKKDGRAVILEPGNLMGKFRCLRCTEIFPYEKAPVPGETKVSPECPRCHYSGTKALTPLVSVCTDPPLEPGVALYIRKSYKVLRQAAQHFAETQGFIERTALPADRTQHWVRQFQGMHEAFLKEVEETADQRLNARLKAHGQDRKQH